MNRIFRLNVLKNPLRLACASELGRTSQVIPTYVEIPERNIFTTHLCLKKSVKSKKSKEANIIKDILSKHQENDEDEAVEFDDGLPKDYKEQSLHLGSRRIDTLINRSIKMSNVEIEKLILRGKVKLNDEILTKKSHNVDKGDVIDVFLETYHENDKLAKISRICVKNYKLEENGYHLEVKLWRSMLVENWKTY